MPKTLKQLASDALSVQNACNILGVSRSYAEAMVDLRGALRAENLPDDTDSIANHPISRLWASQLHNLAGMGLSDMDRYAEADAECKRLAEAA